MAFGRGVLEGISRYLVENPPWSVQLDLRELLVTPPAWLRRWDGDGIITRSTTPEMAEIILKWGIPTVNLTDIYGDQGLPSIWNDHDAIGRMAADHLMQRGLNHFAYCGFTDHHWSEARLRGLLDSGCPSTAYIAACHHVRLGPGPSHRMGTTAVATDRLAQRSAQADWHHGMQ